MSEKFIWFVLFVCIFLLIKNTRTYYVRCKISSAICKYKIDKNLFSNDRRSLNYNYMEPYSKTLWRLWDWGYKRIVPKEIYDKIKDYIE